jgi:hypothetical protein
MPSKTAGAVVEGMIHDTDLPARYNGPLKESELGQGSGLLWASVEDAGEELIERRVNQTRKARPCRLTHP